MYSQHLEGFPDVDYKEQFKTLEQKHKKLLDVKEVAWSVRIRAVKQNSSIFLILVNKTTRSRIQQTQTL
jgi:hypothetical protein